jgi:GT2 family glycosyltransferase
VHRYNAFCLELRIDRDVWPVTMIYVGIVTYNSAADLPECLDALRAQTFSDVTIVAYDNASSDGSAAWMQSHAPAVRLIEGTENLGYGRAHNRLIRLANLQPGDAYLALNPDAILAPNYIQTLWEALTRHNDIGWVTGKLLMKGVDGIPNGVVYSAGHGLLRSGFAFNIGYGLPDAEAFAQSGEVFGAPGAAALYRAQMIECLAPTGDFFDPVMFMYAEDTDIDWRARLQGWRCWYSAEAIAYHRGSSPEGRLKMEAIANRYLSVLKNAHPLELIVFNLPYMAAHCLARLIVTPRLGIHLIVRLLSRAPGALRHRQRAAVSRSIVNAWFRWSAKQPSMQRPGRLR